MSLSALLTAVRNQVRTELSAAPISLLSVECDIWPDGQPPPSFGQRYISVHPTAWRKGPSGDFVRGIFEEYSVSCTITRRNPVLPRDRLTTNLFLESLVGLEALAREIMVAVHDNWTVITAANTAISGTDKIIEALWWQDTDPAPVPRGAEWVWSTNPEQYIATQGNYSVCAMSLEVRFGTARRAQATSTME